MEASPAFMDAADAAAFSSSPAVVLPYAASLNQANSKCFRASGWAGRGAPKRRSPGSRITTSEDV